MPPRSATSSPSVSLPLILMSSITVYCEYWSETQAARSTNSAASCLVHQSLQVALGVELAALVVEAVGQLVADGGAGIAVVGRVVQLRIVERRLQYAGREVDVVHLRVVVGVDRGRRHLPLAAIHRLADFGELAPVFEGVAARGVARIVVGCDGDANCNRASDRGSRSYSPRRGVFRAPSAWSRRPSRRAGEGRPPWPFRSHASWRPRWLWSRG